MDQRIVEYLEAFSENTEVLRLLGLSVGRVLDKTLRRGEDWAASTEPQKIAHVADWLAASLATQAEWLLNVDEDGRPKKLMKFGTMAAIYQEADKAMRRANDQVRSAMPASDGERIVAELSGGLTLVEMLTETALDLESAVMQHCLGNGGYDERLRSGEYAYLSIRDDKGSPHVTFEILKRRRVICQSRGKQNAVPTDKYLQATKEVVSLTGYQVDDLEFIVDRHGEFHEKSALPETLYVHGDLDVSDHFKLGKLPNVLSVEFDLSLAGRSDVTELPTILSVGASIFAAHCGVKDWRPVTMVIGHLDLRDSAAELFPDSLAVGGDLLLRGTPLKRLPRNLGVAGGLDLRATDIEVWPDEMVVGGILDLGRSPKIEIPPKSEIGTLNLQESSLRQLPAGVTVKRDLIISAPILGGGWAEVPDDFKVEGSIKVVKSNRQTYNTGPDHFRGYPCDIYTLEEFRELVASEFARLPF